MLSHQSEVNDNPMERRKRVFTFITFFVCIISLGMLAASLASHKWIVAKPFRTLTMPHGGGDVTNLANTSSQSENSNKFKGSIYFGLFHGTKILNYGLGDRTSPMWSKYVHHSYPLFGSSNMN